MIKDFNVCRKRLIAHRFSPLRKLLTLTYNIINRLTPSLAHSYLYTITATFGLKFNNSQYNSLPSAGGHQMVIAFIVVRRSARVVGRREELSGR